MQIARALAASLALVMIPGASWAQSPSEALAQVFADEREHAWREDPLLATTEGVHLYDDRLASVTPQAQARRLAADRGFLARLQALDRAALTAQEQVSYDLFAFILTQRVTFAGYREWRAPLNSDSGFYTEVLYMHEIAAPRTTRDYENYIARLREVPRYFRENIANMREGLRTRFTLPRDILSGVSAIVAGAQYERAEACPLYEPFKDFPATVPESDRARLTEAGRAAIEEAVIPAYAEFGAFFESEYRPRARRTLGASALPNGRAYYADLARYYTTLPDATPEAIHARGLAEVARIRAEMDAIVAEVDFAGSFADFIAFLRADPQFYAATPEQLLHEAAWIAKEIEGRLPDFFGVLPRTPFTVRAVPAALAPNYTTGRYNPGPTGAAGEYWVNTYDLSMRPLYSLPALTLHEAVPGHHFQGARARELENVPAFRLNFYPHAFGEGWGLYSEKLGVEMGVYHTPYQHFGRLSYEMWRAVRLVVDTGIHSQGWSRERARDYLAANTALPAHEVGTEIDRYIAWPGQALAYKMGELKLWELRARAEAALGADFDIRAFHDAVLDMGGVTLPVLERNIDAYIARAR